PRGERGTTAMLFHPHVASSVLGLLAFVPGLGGGDGAGSWTIPVKPEEANGYPGNPSTLSPPLRQDLIRIALASTDQHQALRLGGGPQPLGVENVDLALLVPRVPRYARGNYDLVRFALLQREFNRNEVKFGPVGDAADFKVANNCLRSGLWEVMLDKKLD